MQTGWFERTRNGTEATFTIADDTKGRGDCRKEGMGLTAETNGIYLSSMERGPFQRREQEMKERRAIAEKSREQHRAPPNIPKYSSSYPLIDFPQRALVIGKDDMFTEDEDTIADPTSPQSAKFAQESSLPPSCAFRTNTTSHYLVRISKDCSRGQEGLAV
jgi:hypothetical protein